MLGLSRLFDQGQDRPPDGFGQGRPGVDDASKGRVRRAVVINRSLR